MSQRKYRREAATVVEGVALVMTLIAMRLFKFSQHSTTTTIAIATVVRTRRLASEHVIYRGQDLTGKGFD